MRALTVALVGNPNVGKTSLFNRLTDSFDHVGNYPGVTVSENKKTVFHKSRAITVVDLPGLYSLSAQSRDEQIAGNFVLNDDYDLILAVCDAKCLSRSLYLVLQLLEKGKKVAVVLNMADELKRSKINVNDKLLSQLLNVPVVRTSARSRSGVAELKQKILPLCLQKSSKTYLPYMENIKYCNESKDDDFEKIATARYGYIDGLLSSVVSVSDAEKPSITDRIDKVALNRYFALPLFLLSIAAAFLLTFSVLGHTLGEALGRGIEWLRLNKLAPFLGGLSVPEWFVSLVLDGIVGTVGGIIVFLPEIALLFFFLSLIEDSGYVSRVAFATDGLFRKIGLTGRAAFTLLMGFGCSATAVLTSRGIDDERVRKKTAMLTPYMSCSAKLPVYFFIADALFPKARVIAVLCLYLLGCVVAITVASITERKIKSLSGTDAKLIIELPPYRLPSLERVFQLLMHHVKTFVLKIGTTVLLLGVIVWVLCNFSFADGFGAASDKSIMATLGGMLAPLFVPLGFGSWRAVSALLSGIVAKESVAGTISALGGVEAVFASDNTVASGVAFLVFTLLYVPCFATIVALVRETGVRFTALALSVQLVVAYSVSLTARLLSIAFTHNSTLTACVIAAVIIFVSSAALIVKRVRRGALCSGFCENCATKCSRKIKCTKRIAK